MKILEGGTFKPAGVASSQGAILHQPRWHRRQLRIIKFTHFAQSGTACLRQAGGVDISILYNLILPQRRQNARLDRTSRSLPSAVDNRDHLGTEGRMKCLKLAANSGRVNGLDSCGRALCANQSKVIKLNALRPKLGSVYSTS